MRKPITAPSQLVRLRQDVGMANVTIDSCLKPLDLNKNPSKAASFSPQPAVISPPSAASSSLARQIESPMPMSYASASSSRPGSSLSSDLNLKTALGPDYAEFSCASVSSSRPASSMSSFPSIGGRPSTALSSNYSVSMISTDGFCQVPIPGLGRGAGRKARN